MKKQKREKVRKKSNIDVKALVDNNLNHISKDLLRKLKLLTKEEKVELVGKLDEMGTFSVKGTIWYLANCMGVSVPTPLSLHFFVKEIKSQDDRFR